MATLEAKTEARFKLSGPSYLLGPVLEPGRKRWTFASPQVIKIT